MHTRNDVFGISSKDLLKARQIAKRKRTSVACGQCRLTKSKCSDYRPCKQCVATQNGPNCFEKIERAKEKKGKSEITAFSYPFQHLPVQQQSRPDQVEISLIKLPEEPNHHPSTSVLPQVLQPAIHQSFFNRSDPSDIAPQLPSDIAPQLLPPITSSLSIPYMPHLPIPFCLNSEQHSVAPTWSTQRLPPLMALLLSGNNPLSPSPPTAALALSRLLLAMASAAPQP